MSKSFAPVEPNSLWRATAVAQPDFDRLVRDETCDVAIIGGGNTGLSTAHYLAKAGLAPIVLEAGRIGSGASGRAGGVVSGEYRVSFRALAARHGLDAARRMHALALASIAHVAELIDELAIPGAVYRPTGSLMCAHTPRALASLAREAAWLRSALNDQAVSMLGAREVADEVGATGFVGGLLHAHGGILHPLNYALGIAARVKAAGVRICENAPVLRLRREGGGIICETPHGVVRARQAVIASNAYSDLTPATSGVRGAIIPFRSAMIATEPLTGLAGDALLPSGRSYTETRRMMRWFRKSGDRLLYGGRGAFGRTDKDSAFAALETAMRRQFPSLAGVKVAYRWSGLVAVTLDALPHVGRLDDRVVFAVGYNGAGVALSSAMGRHVADFVKGGSPDLGPLTRLPLQPIPFYGLREPAVRMVAGWRQFLDAIGI